MFQVNSITIVSFRLQASAFCSENELVAVKLRFGGKTAAMFRVSATDVVFNRIVCSETPGQHST
jgi:hypothetical protein